MTQCFADFMVSTDYNDIPEDVRQVMRRSLLDTIGVAFIGSTTKLSRIARRFTDEFWNAPAHKPGARMVLDGRRVSVAGAAFAGAYTIDAIDAHDGYSAVKGHAGSAVLPAILAVSEERREAGLSLSAQDFMLGLTLAYEVGYRSGLSMHGTVSDYHTSGAWTAVGVAASTARLIGLDKGGIRHAAGIAEYHGPRSQMMRCIEFPTMLRDGVGWGASTGVASAYLAGMGFTGAPAITAEGQSSETWWNDLGTNWQVNETHYKRYPVCRWAHPALDAISELMSENNITHHDIKKIRIQTFHYAIKLAGRNPKNLDELTYSIIYPVAIMAVRGKIGKDELVDEIFHDPEIQHLAQITELVETEHYTKISVRKRWADVTIHLMDGQILQSNPKTPKGDPDDPLSKQEISEKFHSLTEGLLDEARAKDIEDACWEFDKLSPKDFNQLLNNIHTPIK
jgi:2-methylcitrate dehydratase PrpD